MSKLRKVSASDSLEAQSALITNVSNVDTLYTFTFASVSSWGSEVDFITFDYLDDEVDESTRVVWTGEKINPTTITATRTGGSISHAPAIGETALVVPTHKWMNDVIDVLTTHSERIDDNGDILAADGTPVVISLAASEPAPIAGKTVIWIHAI